MPEVIVHAAKNAPKIMRIYISEEYTIAITFFFFFKKEDNDFVEVISSNKNQRRFSDR